MLYYIELTLSYHFFPFHKDKFTKNFPSYKERMNNFLQKHSKTKRARLNPNELVYTFYFKLQHNSIISPEYSDGNDDAYDVTYYSYFVFFVLQIYKRKLIIQILCTILTNIKSTSKYKICTYLVLLQFN